VYKLNYYFLKIKMDNLVSSLEDICVSMDGDEIYAPDYKYIKALLRPYNIDFFAEACAILDGNHYDEEILFRATTEVANEEIILAMIIRMAEWKKCSALEMYNYYELCLSDL
jgi:hypothetical protein